MYPPYQLTYNPPIMPLPFGSPFPSPDPLDEIEEAREIYVKARGKEFYLKHFKNRSWADRIFYEEAKWKAD